MGDWWQAVIDTLVADFSDLPNAAEAARITVRLLIAGLLGGLLGYEREQQHKSAGVRTHMLVAIGAALFVLIPQQAGIAEVEMSRVIQGVIAGVGFLGAGTIIKGVDEEHVRGLTTAAGIWLTAAIGVAAGMGRESSAILCTLLALLILSLVPRVERWLSRRRG